MNEPLPHRWVVRSRHPTSEGTVTYESCHCGAFRIRTGIGTGTAPAPARWATRVLAHPRHQR